MKICGDLLFEEVQENDIEILTPIMKRAFDEDTRIHLGKDPIAGNKDIEEGSFILEKKMKVHKRMSITETRNHKLLFGVLSC